jgi:SprT protein
MTDAGKMTLLADVLVDPIGTEQQQLVIAQTELYIQRAAALLKARLVMIPILFDLKGQAAGMYHVHGKKRWIRYNPYIFSKYFDDNLVRTVPHEVAHYAIDIAYGFSKTAPHGYEWKQLMEDMGADAARTSNYDLTGIPVRRYKKYPYHCGCDTHELGVRRHNSVQQQRAQYYCRKCKQILQLLPD